MVSSGCLSADESRKRERQGVTANRVDFARAFSSSAISAKYSIEAPRPKALRNRGNSSSSHGAADIAWPAPTNSDASITNDSSPRSFRTIGNRPPSTSTWLPALQRTEGTVPTLIAKAAGVSAGVRKSIPVVPASARISASRCAPRVSDVACLHLLCLIVRRPLNQDIAACYVQAEMDYLRTMEIAALIIINPAITGFGRGRWECLLSGCQAAIHGI